MCYVYTYDQAGRLLTVTKDGTLTEEYQYNANGSRIYEMNTLKGIAGRSLSYSDEDHLLAAGGIGYQYNTDGFLTAKIDGEDVTNYDYSSRGELLGVTLPDGTAVEYVHDPLGRRIGKKVNGVIIEKYLWSGLTTLLAVYDGSDNLLMRFEYADSRMPFAVMKEGVLYYLAYDQVGSFKAVADAAGNTFKRVEYDSFGNIVADSNPLFEIPFGFAGGLHDRDTGLVRFGYRDYDPDTGRWTAKDPIGFAGGDTDLFGYVLNNPINFIDPEGLLPWGSIITRGGGKGVLSGGPGALSGGLTGAFAGAAIGTATLIPGMGFAGALIGGKIGGTFGGIFDDEDDGQAGYGEDALLQNYKDTLEADRLLKEAQEINRRLNDLCTRTGGCNMDKNYCE